MLEEGVSALSKNKDAVIGLGLAVGGVLSLAVGVFVERKLSKFVKGIGQAAKDVHSLEQGAVNLGKRIFHIGQPSSSTPGAAPEEQVSTVGSASGTSAGQVTNLGGAAEAAQGQIVSLGAAAETSAGQITSLGAVSEESAGKISTSSAEAETSLSAIGTTAVATATEAETSLTAIGTAAEVTADTEEVAGAEGGEGIAAMLGPIGLVLFAAMEVAEHWKLVKEDLGDVWHFIDREVVHPMEAGFHWLEGEIDSHLGEIEGDVKKFGPALLLLLGPIGLIGAGAIEFVEHWKTVSKVFDEV